MVCKRLQASYEFLQTYIRVNLVVLHVLVEVNVFVAGENLFNAADENTSAETFRK